MISREGLYELVWSKPMIKVGEQFGVSGSYMARVCTALNVPRPRQGYWAKMSVGKAPAPEPLPEARPGDQLFWSRGGELPPLPKPQSPSQSRIGRRIRLPRTRIHGLVRNAKRHFENSRPIDEGAYLKPFKMLLVDVTVSKACLDKALEFANDLFNALESVGHSVVIAPAGEHLGRDQVDEREDRKKPRKLNYNTLWSPLRPTVVFIDDVAIGLAILEMSEEVLLRYVRGKYIRDADYVPPRSHRYSDHSWTTTRNLPSGRLRLFAYSPYHAVSWSTDWQETGKRSLKPSLKSIVKSIEEAAVELVPKMEEAARKAEVARLEWLAEEERHRKEEDRRRVERSVQDSQEHLRQIIGQWSDVMGVERFLAGVEQRAAELPECDRKQVLERLKLAREFLGTQDPLEFFLSWKTPLERYQPLFGDADADSKDEAECEGP